MVLQAKLLKLLAVLSSSLEQRAYRSRNSPLPEPALPLRHGSRTGQGYSSVSMCSMNFRNKLAQPDLWFTPKHISRAPTPHTNASEGKVYEIRKLSGARRVTAAPLRIFREILRTKDSTIGGDLYFPQMLLLQEGVLSQMNWYMRASCTQLPLDSYQIYSFNLRFPSPSQHVQILLYLPRQTPWSRT